MAGIDDFNPNGASIDIALSAPARDTRVPSALLFPDKSRDLAILFDEIVGTDFRLLIGQTAKRLLCRLHAGVVEDQHVDRSVGFALIEVG